MNSTELCAIAAKHRTDKWPGYEGGKGHGYTPWYCTQFENRRTQIENVFELGIDTGASLYMWEEYFPNARIWGADIHTPGLINRERISSFFVDQESWHSLMYLRGKLPPSIDLIIDDGSHDPFHQTLTAIVLMPLLAPGGMYVIEDVASRILGPWNVDGLASEMVEFDVQRKTDDRLIVFRRPYETTS